MLPLYPWDGAKRLEPDSISFPDEQLAITDWRTVSGSYSQATVTDVRFVHGHDHREAFGLLLGSLVTASGAAAPPFNVCSFVDPVIAYR